jgi:hypothetical protein
VRDPDGNQLEAFVVLKDNLAETTTCCGTGETEQAATTASGTASAATESTTAQTAASCCAPAAIPNDAVNTAAVHVVSVCCDAATVETPVTISR